MIPKPIKNVNLDMGVSFDPIPHKYTDKFGTNYTSVSFYVKSFFPFPEHIKVDPQRSQVARDYGTYMHKLCEDYILNNSCPDYGTYKNLYDFLQSELHNIVGSEVMLFEPSLGLAGTADLLLNRGGRILIGDFKTNKSLSYNNGLCAHPLATIQNTTLNGYFFQMSIYAYLLKSTYGIVAEGVEIWHIEPETYKVKIYESPVLWDWVEDTLPYFSEGKCKICGHQSKNSRGRNSHIKSKHPEWSIGKYYEHYYANYCIVCNNLIKFKKEKYSQYKFCSQECMIKKFQTHVPANKGDYLIDDETLLQELKDLHKKYGGYVTQSLLRTNGKFHHQLYYSRFGSWQNACKKAEVPCFKHITCSYNSKTFYNHITIIVDTREGKPYFFEDSITKKLDVGDYAFEGFENELVIERKSLNDLKCTFSMLNISRFKRELSRARKNNTYVVILADTSIKNFYSSPKFGKASNNSIMHLIKETCSIYADCCQILFSGSKTLSNKIVSWILIQDKEYLKGTDLQREYDLKEGIFDMDYYPFGQNE